MLHIQCCGASHAALSIDRIAIGSMQPVTKFGVLTN